MEITIWTKTRKYSQLIPHDQIKGLPAKQTRPLAAFHHSKMDQYNGKHFVFGWFEGLGQSEDNPLWADETMMIAVSRSDDDYFFPKIDEMLELLDSNNAAGDVLRDVGELEQDLLEYAEDWGIDDCPCIMWDQHDDIKEVQVFRAKLVAFRKKYKDYFTYPME